MLEIPSDTMEVIVKATPPAVLVAWSFHGVTLQEFAAIAAIIYTTFMTIFLLIDRYKKWKKEKDETL